MNIVYVYIYICVSREQIEKRDAHRHLFDPFFAGRLSFFVWHKELNYTQENIICECGNQFLKRKKLHL